MKEMFKKFMMLFLVMAIFISCSDDNDINTDGQGQVKVQLTDGPFPFNFVTQANVEIAKIQLQDSNGALVTVFEGSAAYNMIGLANGVSTDIATANIPVGTYVEARVTLSDASIKLSNNTVFDLNVSTSIQYVFDINPGLVVEDAISSDLLFDLDINDSFQFFGMGGVQFPSWINSMDLIQGCNFNPDFRVCDRDLTGEISGTVTVNGNTEANVQVYIYVDGHRISTHTEADGSFTFVGIPNGTYTVHANTSTNANVSVANVSVANFGTATCTVTIN